MSTSRFTVVGRTSSVGVCLVLLWCIGGAAFGDAKQPSAATPLPGVEPKADAVLRDMSRSLAGAKQLSVRATDMADELMDNGQKIQFARTVNLAARRPGAILATSRGDREDLQYAYDGSRVTIVNHRERCYAVQDVPRTIDEMFDFLAERYGITAPLADLLFSDPYAAMTGRVRSGQYVGMHAVGTTPCHHLAFRQDGIDWQIWVEDSPRAVPRKVVITYKDLPGQPQFVALLDEWNLSAELSDAALALKPPADYKRIDLQPVSSPTTAPANENAEKP